MKCPSEKEQIQKKENTILKIKKKRDGKKRDISLNFNSIILCTMCYALCAMCYVIVNYIYKT